MKKTRRIWVAGLLFAAAAACQDNTFKMFAPPDLLFSTADKPVPQPRLLDSMKNLLKNKIQGNTYAFNVVVLDPENAGVTDLQYSLSGGTGMLTCNERIIPEGSSVTGVTSGENKGFVFKPDAYKAVYTLSFRGVNRYNVVGAPYVITLVIYENLPPTARFIVKPGNDGKNSRVLDASASKDEDERFGGIILTYIYEIRRNSEPPFPPMANYDKTSKTTPCGLPGPGVYSITLVVYDNDGAPSPPFTLIETVK